MKTSYFLINGFEYDVSNKTLVEKKMIHEKLREIEGKMMTVEYIYKNADYKWIK
jgi:hypothetical protein